MLSRFVSSPAPSSYGAPPAGADAATPRPDLRGFRLGLIALISRVAGQIHAKRIHGLVGGFVAGGAVGIALSIAGGPIVLAVLAAAAVNVAVALWLPTALLTPPDRRLLGIIYRIAAHAGMAWRRAYGNAPIPRTEEQQLLWIAAQPNTSVDPDAIAVEGSTLMVLGRYEEARERIERLPDDTPWWRFERALGFAALGFESGGPGDLAEARAAAAAVHGERRATAIAALGLEEAVQAMIRGDDWDVPIARASAAVPSPVIFGILAGLYRARSILPWLIVSEVALAAALTLLSGRDAI